MAARGGPGDGGAVTVGHHEVRDLAGAHEDELLVLVAEGGCGVAVVRGEVGDDEDVSVREDLVDPGVERLADRGAPAELLLDLALEARRRVLTGLELAAGQLPLVALVAQQGRRPRQLMTALTETGSWYSNQPPSCRTR
nr:hypothetical protein GCM10025730_08340 [Promicromonospora thailandica]